MLVLRYHGATARTVNNKTYGSGYYYLEEDDLVQLGVKGTTRNFIVSYDTGEVIVTEPYLVNQRFIYYKSALIAEETENAVTGLADYDATKGVNKPVLFRGMLPVKLNGSTWEVTSVDDPEWYDYAATSNGPARMANVMLMDDVTLVDSMSGKLISNEKVRGAELEDLVGCRVADEGSMFVWVPRYTYKEGTNEIVYSKLTNDYLLNGFIKSPAFYNGEYRGATPEDVNGGYMAGGMELTGIWISKFEATYKND